jgi:hypothetical protein
MRPSGLAGETGKQQQQQEGVMSSAEGPVCYTLQQAQQQLTANVQMPQVRHRKAAATPGVGPTAAAANSAGGVGGIGTAAAAPGRLMQVNKPQMDAVMSKLDKQSHRQQHHQQSYRLTSRVVRPFGSSSSSSIGSGSGGRGIKGWLKRKWQAGSARLGHALEDAAAWVLSMLWLGLCWLAGLLLTPITALFGPWYRYNRWGAAAMLFS